MSNQSHAMFARRGFTLVVIPLLLVISMVVLGVLLANKPGAPGTTSSAAYNTGKQWGPVVGSLLFGLFMLGVASKIAENRGHKTATVIIGGILLLANFAFLMNVLGLAKPLPGKQRGGNIARMLSGNQPAPSAEAAPVTPEAPAPRAAARREPRPLPEPPSEGATPSPAPRANPVSPPRPVPQRPARPAERPEPASADFAEVAAYLAADAPGAKEPLEKLAKDLGDITADLAMKAATFATAAMTVPKHDRAMLKQRREEAEAIKSLAEHAEERLGNALEDAKSRLTAAGVDGHDVLGLAIRFSNMTKANSRAFAAGAYGRFADDVIEETTLLEKHFAKWKLDKDKKIMSEDFKVRGELTGPRMRVEGFGHRAGRTAEQLGGQ